MVELMLPIIVDFNPEGEGLVTETQRAIVAIALSSV